MDNEVAAEVRDLLASARAALAELSEEGVERAVAAPVETGAPQAESRSAEVATPPAARSAEVATPPVAASVGGDVPPAGVATSPATSPATSAATSAATSVPAPSAATPSSDAPAAAVPEWDASTTLEGVRTVLGECTRCRLSEGRNTIVFGDGNPDADLMFVGEGPGADEDRRGLPFVGRAGELLTAMIEKGLEIPRSEVYICNVVKCRPPDNRTPHADEAVTCSPFLHGQIAAVKPKVIVALGKHAASLLLGRDVGITRLRGTWQDYRGIPLMPTLHPAYVLRRYTDENRRAVWSDLKAALTRARGEA